MKSGRGGEFACVIFSGQVGSQKGAALVVITYWTSKGGRLIFKCWNTVPLFQGSSNSRYDLGKVPASACSSSHGSGRMKKVSPWADEKEFLL